MFDVNRIKIPGICLHDQKIAMTINKKNLKIMNKTEYAINNQTEN
jgi:hypothetical protein